MAAPNIKRQLEAGTVYIPIWHTGLYTQRSPIFTPLSAMGVQVISKYDTLWAGQNMELSLKSTLVRRPGFPEFCNQPFEDNEYPLNYFSFKDLSGNIYPLVDTQLGVYYFGPTFKDSILTKTSGAQQTCFQQVGGTVYGADGEDLWQWIGLNDDSPPSLSTPFPIGLAVPTQAPSWKITSGVLLPQSGWTYGYSFGNSNTGAVSTMSPVSSDIGDLNVKTITEAHSSTMVSSLTTAGSVGGSAGTLTVGTPNGNNFWVGAQVTISGASPSPINTLYTITACSASEWQASTSVWGPTSPDFGQNADVQLPNVTGVTCEINPLVVPGSSASPAYTYTVINSGAAFLASNVFGGATPLVVKGTTGKVYTQVASAGDISGTGQIYVDTNGDILFYSGDAGNPFTVTYQYTPTGGAATCAFIVTGPSSNSITQSDLRGYSGCDFVDLFRSNDGDATGGPWNFLVTLPNNIALVSVSLYGGLAVYNFAQPSPAGANNGFATASGTGGATIAGFTHSANNGTFDIVASSEWSITCQNTSGVAETHSGTVNASGWTYTDNGSVYQYSYDPTIGTDGELDILIEAPIDDANNPPPTVDSNGQAFTTTYFTMLAFNAGRLWGAVDNYVYFAGGPDTTLGSGRDAWPPDNVFPFPGKVTALLPVSAGLVVFTSDDMWIIYGTSTASFYSNKYQSNLGVQSQNCVVQDGDIVYIYTSNAQLYCFTGTLSEPGFNIGDQLQAYFPPPTSYLALHKHGDDAGLFISDGGAGAYASPPGPTNMYKYRIDQQSWSTVTQVVGGAGAIKSIETSTAEYTLLAGPIEGLGTVMGRDETDTIFYDGTSTNTYPCNATVGSIIFCPPGTTSAIQSVLIERMPPGPDAIISIAADEIAGPFVTLPNPRNEPPLLPPSKTIIKKRHHLSSAQQPLPQQMQHCMVNIAFPAANAKSEILALGFA